MMGSHFYPWSLLSEVPEMFIQGHRRIQTNVSIVLSGLSQDYSLLLARVLGKQLSFPNGLQEWTVLVYEGKDICSDFTIPREHKTKHNTEFVLIVLSQWTWKSCQIWRSVSFGKRHNEEPEECTEKESSGAMRPTADHLWGMREACSIWGRTEVQREN